MEQSVAVRQVPLLPLRDITVFPHMVAPLFVGRAKSINALEEAMGAEKEILLVAQREATTSDPTSKDLFSVGTLGTIIQLLKLPDGTVKVLVEGKQRAKMVRHRKTRDYLCVDVELLADEEADPTVELQELVLPCREGVSIIADDVASHVLSVVLDHLRCLVEMGVEVNDDECIRVMSADGIYPCLQR